MHRHNHLAQKSKRDTSAEKTTEPSTDKKETTEPSTDKKKRDSSADQKAEIKKDDKKLDLIEEKKEEENNKVEEKNKEVEKKKTEEAKEQVKKPKIIGADGKKTKVVDDNDPDVDDNADDTPKPKPPIVDNATTRAEKVIVKEKEIMDVKAKTNIDAKAGLKEAKDEFDVDANEEKVKEKAKAEKKDAEKDDEKTVSQKIAEDKASKADRKVYVKKMNKAVVDLNKALKTEETANNEYDMEKVKYNSKLEVEKTKAASDIGREKKIEKEKETKLPLGTDAEIWTANMPKHHFESLTQKKSEAGDSDDEDSSSEEESDEDE